MEVLIVSPPRVPRNRWYLVKVPGLSLIPETWYARDGDVVLEVGPSL